MGFTLDFLLKLCPSGGFRGAYDPFAASIVHAYEPARRVLTSYTGNLVRLRRASDNAEAAFGYLANGDLDTAAIAAWAGGASYIVTVYDQGGFADNATQAVAASQPLYVANARNGHAGMTFDGANDYLRGAFTIGGALSRPYHIYAVGQLDPTAVNDNTKRGIVDSNHIARRASLRQDSTPTPDQWAIYAGAFLNDGNSDGNWNLWTVLFNYAASQFWINSVSVATGDAGDLDNATGITIGETTDFTGPWVGPVVSVVICDPSLSDAQRVAMQGRVNSYWMVY
ncbi:MAG TPA: arabinofuranosidase catalytic domain-containing protein [Anaerolineae bacterium]|nr:arabinofuranosidase catalytic domain-containing protein [Anaerolineae bacterium]